MRLSRFARKTLTPPFTDFFTDFEKKTTVLQSYSNEAVNEIKHYGLLGVLLLTFFFFFFFTAFSSGFCGRECNKILKCDHSKRHRQ